MTPEVASAEQRSNVPVARGIGSNIVASLGIDPAQVRRIMNSVEAITQKTQAILQLFSSFIPENVTSQLESHMSTAPTPTPDHPILRNLLQLLLQYGPVLLNLLISSGILKLPPGTTLPPLPTTPTSALDPALKTQLQGISVEVDAAKLAAYVHDGAKLLAESLVA